MSNPINTPLHPPPYYLKQFQPPPQYVNNFDTESRSSSSADSCDSDDDSCLSSTNSCDSDDDSCSSSTNSCDSDDDSCSSSTDSDSLSEYSDDLDDGPEEESDYRAIVNEIKNRTKVLTQLTKSAPPQPDSYPQLYEALQMLDEYIRTQQSQSDSKVSQLLSEVSDNINQNNLNPSYHPDNDI
jgi:hypothetical protein